MNGVDLIRVPHSILSCEHLGYSLIRNLERTLPLHWKAGSCSLIQHKGLSQAAGGAVCSLNLESRVETGSVSVPLGHWPVIVQ